MHVDTQERVPAQIVAELERTFGLSRVDMTRALGVNVRTVERWRRGIAAPQREARERLRTLLRLRDRLNDTFKTEAAERAWLHRQNLRGLTPADALRVGRTGRVDGALEVIDAGIFV